MRDIVVDFVSKQTGLKKEEVENFLEVPPTQDLGDFAFPCYVLAKQEKKSPLLISEKLTEKLRKKLPKEITNVDFKSAYVNFFIDKKVFADGVLKKKLIVKLDNKKIGIEYPSPNTNKPLHVGHLRNMALGDSVARVCNFVGNNVSHLNLFNDRGILISKSMVGYEKYGKNQTPKDVGKEGDVFVGDFYVKFSKESKENIELEELAKEKLRLWESKDKEVLALWKKMNSWAYSGIEKTFKKFGLLKIDKTYYESDIYEKGKEIVEQGLKKKILAKKEDGAIFIDLENEKLGEKILLRGDGTSVYMTTDLFLAKQKVEDFKLDSSYYVVGNDQDYHFKALFSILDKLGMKKDWKHLSYGMVTLPEGKMKSREGTTVSAEDLIKNTKELAMTGLIERGVNKKEAEERALKIALAAIKYHLLKVDYKKNLVFNPKEALAFEGDTGPYLLYSYARANSIFKKAESKKAVKIIDLKNEEIALLKKIDSFSEVIENAYKNLAPNLIANYSYELAKLFNEFYHACPVLGSSEEGFRLALIKKFRETIKESLFLLGIEVIEEM